MGLRLVTQDAKRIDIGDEGDFIEVRSDISRRDFNTILATLPTNTEGVDEANITFQVADEFAQGLFEVFVTGWSLDVPATVENYNNLTRDSASLIDSAVTEHFNSLTPTQPEVTKSENAGEE